MSRLGAGMESVSAGWAAVPLHGEPSQSGMRIVFAGWTAASLVGAAVLLRMTSSGLARARTKRRGAVGVGTVTTITFTERSRETGLAYTGPDGASLTQTLVVDAPPYRVGDKVPIRYDRERPEIVVIPTAQRFGGVLTGFAIVTAATIGSAVDSAVAATTGNVDGGALVFGAIMCVICAVIAGWRLGRDRAELAVLRHGRPAAGTVIDTIPGRGTIVGHPIVEFTAANGLVYDFCDRRADYLKPGETVELRYDPANPYRASCDRSRDRLLAVVTRLAACAALLGFAAFCALQA